MNVSARTRSPEHAEAAIAGEPTRDMARRAAGTVAPLVVAVLVGLAWVAQRPPSPVPASAPATEFSAERAYDHLAAIAADEPTPIGSPGGDAVRDYLVAELSALGFAVEVQQGVGAYTFDADTAAGRVENVVATLPGHDSTGRVVLAAHYDTTFGTPGAADDKAAVAALVETARALTSGEPVRNDVVVLLTDGEEPGLLGAASFVAQHPYGAEGGVVLNWEATGNTGASVLFETSADNAGLIAELAASAPHPAGDSALAAMYEAGTQNTDFTVFKDDGFIGLNFALIDGIAAYHHSRDTVANLDTAAMQHHGANMLGLARSLGDRDLAAVMRSDHDATFFTVFGRVIAYPMWLVWPLAGFASTAVVAVAIVARRRGLATMPRLLAGAAAGLVPLMAAPGAAIALWTVLVAIRPGYATMFMGDPYRPQLYRWALGALTATVVLVWYLLLRRRIGAVPLAAGALVWPALFGIVTAWQVPPMSYYGALTAAAAAAGLVVALLLGDRRPVWRAAALTAGALPGAVLLMLGGRTLLGIMGIALGAVGVFFYALAGLMLLPLVELALPARSAGPAGSATSTGRRPSVLVPASAATLAVALTGAGLVVDRFDEDHPRVAHLMYVLDTGTDSAEWVTQDRSPHAWAADLVPDRDDAAVALPLPYGTVAQWTGAAEALPLEAPRLEVLDSRTDGEVTVLELQAASSRDADVITLHADRPVEDVAIAVDGHEPVTSTPSYSDDVDADEWPYELRFYDPPPEGIRLTLRLPGSERPRISLSDYTVGLAQLPGIAPRPTDLDRSPDHSSDLVVVGRAHQP